MGSNPSPPSSSRRSSARSVDTRCPYCHDLLAVDAAQVDCGGCGTRHHGACIEELGRCTVLGCAWTVDGRPPPPILASPTEALRRQVAERVRTRGTAYRAARDAARVAGEGPPQPPPAEAPWESPTWDPTPLEGDALFIHPDTLARASAANIWLGLLCVAGALLWVTAWALQRERAKSSPPRFLRLA